MQPERKLVLPNKHLKKFLAEMDWNIQPCGDSITYFESNFRQIMGKHIEIQSEFDVYIGTIKQVHLGIYNFERINNQGIQE
mgnify:CR=1